MNFFLINLFFLIIYIVKSGRIHIRKTKTFDWIWDDFNTGSTDDASFWIPHLNSDNEYYITMHAGRGHDGPDEVGIVITNAPKDVLKKPQPFGWKRVWTDIGSGGNHNVMFIQPKPEPGYICFGAYIHVSENYDNPGDPAIYGSNTWHKYRCVHKKWVNVIDNKKDQSQWIWNDNDSGADDDGSIFKINVDRLPYHYYRTDGPNGHPSSYPGPYYELLPYINDCNIIKIEINSDKNLISDMAFGKTFTSDIGDDVSFNNDAYEEKSVTLLSTEKCVTTSTKFTHTIGYELSLGITYSFKRSISKASPFQSDFGLEISLNAKQEQEWKKEVTKETKSCTKKTDEKILCPPRSVCSRKYFALKPVKNSVDLKITLMCGIKRDTKEILYGKFESTGALKYIVQNKINPMDCRYYSNKMSDINIGLLPFCDRCMSNKKCLQCRDHMVLTNGQCVTDQICEDDCNGETKGDTRDGWGKIIPFIGAYCKNEQLNITECYKSIYPELKCSNNSYLYSSNNNKLNDIKNNCGLDGNCNNRLFDGTINDCYNRCLNNPKCKSYTFKRFINNNNDKKTICNIYDIIQPNNYVIGEQKMCIMKRTNK